MGLRYLDDPVAGGSPSPQPTDTPTTGRLRYLDDPVAAGRPLPQGTENSIWDEALRRVSTPFVAAKDALGQGVEMAADTIQRGVEGYGQGLGEMIYADTQAQNKAGLTRALGGVVDMGVGIGKGALAGVSSLFTGGLEAAKQVPGVDEKAEQVERWLAWPGNLYRQQLGDPDGMNPVPEDKPLLRAGWGAFELGAEAAPFVTGIEAVPKAWQYRPRLREIPGDVQTVFRGEPVDTAGRQTQPPATVADTTTRPTPTTTAVTPVLSRPEPTPTGMEYGVGGEMPATQQWGLPPVQPRLAKPTVEVPKPVEIGAPGPTLEGVGGVQGIPGSQIATRPDLMQFKQMTDETTGASETHKETIGGDWDPIKGGNLLLWEPKNPAEYGLGEGQKYIVADGHGRFNYGRSKGVETYNAQILKEADGYTANDAMVSTALKNIADGKGTIYDQTRFLRVLGKTLGEDNAIARAKKDGITGKRPAEIAFAAADSLYDSFINERVTPEQAAALANAAPRNEAVQQMVLSEIVAQPKMSPSDVRQMVASFEASGVTGQSAKQVDLFGKNESAMIEMRQMAKAASAIIDELKAKARIGKAVTTRATEAGEVGIKASDQTAVLAQGARAEVDNWERFNPNTGRVEAVWQLDPAKVRQVRERAGLPVKAEMAPVLAKPAGETPSGQKVLLDEGDGGFKLVGEKKSAEQIEAERVAEEKRLADERERVIRENTTDMFGGGALGAVAPGTRELMMLQDWLRPKETDAITDVNVSARDIVPDFQSPATEAAIANKPYGLERLPGIGRLFSKVQGARTPHERAGVTWMSMSKKAGDIKARVLQELRGEFGEKERVNESGQMIGVTPNFEGLSLAPGDVFERWLTDREAYTLSPEVDAMFRRHAQILMAAEKLLQKHGLAEPEGTLKYPRPVVGKLHEVTGEVVYPSQMTSGSRLGSKQMFQKERLYPTEAEGAQTTKYDPDLNRRVANRVGQALRLIADQQFLNDPALGGETPTARLERLKVEFADDLASGRKTMDELQRRAEHPLLTKEGIVGDSAFAGKIYPIEVADYLNKFLKTESMPEWRFLREATYLTKGYTYGLDATQVALQTPLIAAANGKAGLRSLANSAITLLADPKHMDQVYKEHQQAVREMSQLGRRFGDPTDFMVGATGEHFIGKVPGIGWLARRTSAAFGASLDTGAIYLWEALSPRYDKAQWPELMNYINSVTMRGRRTAVGPRQVLIEDATLGAANMARAAGDLTANLGMKGVAGDLSRKTVGKFVAGASAVVLGICLAQNKDWDEIADRLNPASPRWLSIPVGGVEIALGGPLKSALGAVAKTVAAAVTEPSRLASLSSMENPMLRYLRGRLGPVTGGAVDVLTEADYLGRDASVGSVLRSRSLPLSWQNLVPGTQADSPPQWTAAPEMLGLITYKPSASTERRDLQNRLAKQQFGVGYDKLPLTQQGRLQEQVDKTPGLRAFSQTRQQAKRQVDIANDRRGEVLDKVPENLRPFVKDDVLRIPLWDNRVTVGGRPVRLSVDQSKQFDNLMVQEYAARLTKVAGDPRWRQSDQFRKQRVINEMRSAAEREAQRKFAELDRLTKPVRPVLSRVR